MSSYAFLSADSIVCSHVDQGVSRLATLDTRTGKLTEINSPLTDIQYLRAANGYAVFRAASPTTAAAIVRLQVDQGTFETLRRSNSLDLDPSYFSVPEAIEFPTGEDLTAHAFYHPPQSPDYCAGNEFRPDRQESWWTNCCSDNGAV
jgi:dipeptidyl aminopeptidase/acylaminoacyl peptidase